MTGQIKRQALGRSGQLGDLYNAHTDDFLTGHIFGDNLPEDVVRWEDCAETKFKFDRVNNYSSTLDNLEIEAELKLNILSGILTVEGRGKYLSNISKSTDTHKITLSLFIKRKRQILQISFEKLSKHICERAFGDQSATHIVTEVQWGANIFATFEQQKTSSDARETIEGALTAELRKAGALLAGGMQANVNAGGTATSNIDDLHIEFSGDVEMTRIPTTIAEALDVIKTIPECISRMNGGKGVQIQFRLSPIQEVLRFVSPALKSSFENTMIREANRALVSLIQFTFDELLILEQRIHQLTALVAKYREGYLDRNDVHELNLDKIELEELNDKFRRHLAVLLKDLRMSKTPEDEENFSKEITDLAKKHYQVASQETEQFLIDYKGIRKKCEVLEQLKAMNVECVKLDATFRESSDKETYVLLTSGHLLDDNTKQFDEEYNKFIDLIKKKNHACFVFIDTNDPELKATTIDRIQNWSRKPASGGRGHHENKHIIPCRWGSECRDIKDAQHRKRYSHRRLNSKDDCQERNEHRTPCYWAAQCTNHSDEHRKKYYHPRQDSRTPCKWGRECTNHSDEHREKYFHPQPDEHSSKLPCKWKSECTDFSPNHRRKYAHPND